MSQNNEIMVVNRADIAGTDMMATLLNSENNFYSSIQNDGSRASMVKIYNAVNSADGKLDDHKNEEFELVDVIAHPLKLVDENTGELVDCMRTVLVMADGKRFEAISQGIVSSLSKMFGIFGQPTYNPPLKVKVVEQKTRSGFKTNTLEVIG